ncbi:MAG: protoheme IX farnesyltransferase [Calditrichaeota bacterium]|nr:protoheme IX farnesyltransferase [Calditrichota bacterium]
MNRPLSVFLTLIKIRISGLVALSTATGFVLATGQLSPALITPVLGIFLLAAGSAALNQYQERELDARMERTRSRPIPSGQITPQGALAISLLLMAVGSVVLWMGAGHVGLALGLLNVLWYNGIYTPLKRITPFAVIPGAVIGAIPPAVGWIAGGRSLLEPQLWALALFFFIWQIPHFWLLLLNFGKDYEKAGFPSLTTRFSPPQLARITYAWILATSLTCLAIPLYGLGHSYLVYIALAGSAIWLVWSSRILLKDSLNTQVFYLAFREVNIFILLIMIFLTLDRLMF